MRGRSRQVLVSAPGFASSARTAQRGFRSLRLLLASDVCAFQQRASGDEAVGKGAGVEGRAGVSCQCDTLPPVPRGLPLHCRRKPEATGISQEALLSIVLEMLAGGVQGGVGGVSLRGGRGDAAHARFLAALVGESLARTPWGLKA